LGRVQDLLDIRGELLRFRSVDAVDLSLELFELFARHLVLDIVQVEALGLSLPGCEHDERLNDHETDLVGDVEEKPLLSHFYPGDDVSHQFLGHVIIGQGIDHGAQVGIDWRDED